jgi:hypothetical protein
MEKYFNWYKSIIERAKNRKIKGYREKHHILPRCMGGEDSKENLVYLTPEEHYVCHQILIRMYPNESSLIFAAKMMTVNNFSTQKRNGNKLYGWLKRKAQEQMSLIQKDTAHINKNGKKKKIKKEELGFYIEKGWKLGDLPRSKEHTNKIHASRKKNFFDKKIKSYMSNPDLCWSCKKILPYLSPGKRKRRSNGSLRGANCGSFECRSKTAKANAEIRKQKNPIKLNNCRQCNEETKNPKFCCLKCSNIFYAINRKR